jgi:hypothetical protein
MLGETVVECEECGALVPIDRAEYVDLEELGGYWRCNRCLDADWYDGEYDGGDPDDDEDLDYWLRECGQQPDGTCLNAGTEECDFECPFRSLLYKDEEE